MGIQGRNEDLGFIGGFWGEMGICGFKGGLEERMGIWGFIGGILGFMGGGLGGNAEFGGSSGDLRGK